MGAAPVQTPDEPYKNSCFAMKIIELLDPERIACDLKANSKKRVLEHLSLLLAESAPELTEEEVFETLIGRERLGSTGLGHGVAIPHGRLKGRDRAIAAFVKLDQGVDFDALDNQPVDLLFALLVPDHFTSEHLEILAQLAQMFDSEELCRELRQSSDCRQVLDLLHRWEPQQSSASA